MKLLLVGVIKQATNTAEIFTKPRFAFDTLVADLQNYALESNV